MSLKPRACLWRILFFCYFYLVCPRPSETLICFVQLHLPYFTCNYSQYAYEFSESWGLFIFFMQLQFWSFSELISHKLWGEGIESRKLHQFRTSAGNTFLDLSGVCSEKLSPVLVLPHVAPQCVSTRSGKKTSLQLVRSVFCPVLLQPKILSGKYATLP